MNLQVDHSYERGRSEEAFWILDHKRNGSQWRCVSSLSGKLDLHKDMLHQYYHNKSLVSM